MKYMIIVAVAASACAPYWTDDKGLIQRGGLELYAHLPIGVQAHESIEERQVEAAIRWWNGRIGAEVFYYGSPTPDATVEVGDTGDEFINGLAQIDYSNFDGLITNCRIIISQGAASVYSGDYITEIIKHELGHCIGLQDDVPSLYLYSIMADPIWSDGKVTPMDYDIVRGLLDE